MRDIEISSMICFSLVYSFTSASSHAHSLAAETFDLSWESHPELTHQTFPSPSGINCFPKKSKKHFKQCKGFNPRSHNQRPSRMQPTNMHLISMKSFWWYWVLCHFSKLKQQNSSISCKNINKSTGVEHYCGEIWFILEYNFQIPEGPTFVSFNNYTQV